MCMYSNNNVCIFIYLTLTYTMCACVCCLNVIVLYNLMSCGSNRRYDSFRVGTGLIGGSISQ